MIFQKENQCDDQLGMTNLEQFNLQILEGKQAGCHLLQQDKI